MALLQVFKRNLLQMNYINGLMSKLLNMERKFLMWSTKILTLALGRYPIK